MFIVSCLGWSVHLLSESQADHGAISAGATVMSIAERNSCTFLLRMAHINSAHVLLARIGHIPLYNFKGQREWQLQSYCVPKRRRTRIFVNIPHDYQKLGAEDNDYYTVTFGLQKTPSSRSVLATTPKLLV